MNKSLWEILAQSGLAMWVIIGCSVLAIGVALERLVAQWRFIEKARALADTVGRCLNRGALAEGRAACERSSSPLADVFLVGYERLGRSSREALEAAVDRERLRVTTELKTRLWILGTIGATAPFVGLFGTVLGIMRAFGDIAIQNGGGLGVVSKGISEALYATAAGIAVAVQSVVIYNFFNQRLSRVAIELKLLTDEYLELLRERDLAPSPELKPADKEKAKDGTREAA